MNKNQKGFSLIETILVVLVLVLIGIAGWLVYQKGQTKDETGENAKTSETNEADQSKVSELGITYDKPEGWTETRTEPVAEAQYPVFAYESPEFMPADGMGIEKGASIYISAAKTEHKNLDELLAFDDLKQYSYITNHKRFKINGIDAYSYDVDYEGQRHNTVFYLDSVEYNVVLEWSYNEEQSVYKPVLDELIDSIAAK